MRNTEEILKELKEIQAEIAKGEAAKNINCKKYDEALKNHEYTLCLLHDISRGGSTIEKTFIDTYDAKNSCLKLISAMRLLIEFADELSNKFENELLLTELKGKEQLLKKELGIKWCEKIAWYSTNITVRNSLTGISINES